uniref:NADH:ubiquinone reductase (H(+)-translocating) n=1 Tax=Neomaskellia andropogonis TaxID=266944 RepID=Q697G2_NEOAD|nr:NADH dehydrogenase subunit 5 [Neomaskellia andropogonis]
MKKLIMAMIILSNIFLYMNNELMKYNYYLMIEWNMMNKEMSNIKMTFMMSEKSTLFTMTVLLIFSSIMMYSIFYMSQSKNMMFFSKSMLMFVISMMILILSISVITMLLGWEGLGMTSFILILFYNTSKTSSSAKQTMIINRIGDITLMISIMMLMNTNSSMIISINMKEEMIICMLTISALTKSAQIPFSSWLTEAMMAPTPVSALVHSSTLVTAGVYMILLMEKCMSFTIKMLILTMSLITLIMSSLNSMTEYDMKKIIALSTLSQMSIMFISISMELTEMAFFHMILHASFKSLIFMCASSYISMFNTQDMRLMNINKTLPLTKTAMMVANMALVGIPYTSSFYSKDIIIEMMMTKFLNKLMSTTFVMLMMFTMIYSMKMINLNNNNKMMMKKESMEMKLSTLILLTSTILSGMKMNWLVSLKQASMITKMEKFQMIIMMTIVLNLNFTKKKKQYMMKNLSLINSMWFLKTLMTKMKMMTLSLSINFNKTTEKGLITNNINNLNKMIKNLSKSNLIKSISNLKNLKWTTMLTTLILVL